MNIMTQKAADHIAAFFSSEQLGTLAFHNLKHTEQVKKAAMEVGVLCGLAPEDMEHLVLAAWFHDVGYVQCRSGHEQHSAFEARRFLEAEGFDPARTETVCATIMETVFPQQPQTVLGKILCDADLSMLGSKKYLKSAQRLRLENEQVYAKRLSDSDWVKGEIAFLENHQYHTEQAKALYEEGKQKNLSRLFKMQSPQNNDLALQPGDLDRPTSNQEEEKTKKKAKEGGLTYGRGVETMFRAGAKTHINLSAMADSKANIMLSVNAMILSITLTVLLPKLENNLHLIVPSIALVLTCLASMILATLATRPNVSHGVSSKEAIINRKSNLLFFGNFHDMKIEDYEWGMREMMQDNAFLYGSLTRDLYFLGKVLHKKYKYLRLCYNVFMGGMILSVLIFGVSLYMVSRP